MSRLKKCIVFLCTVLMLVSCKNVNNKNDNGTKSSLDYSHLQLDGVYYLNCEDGLKDKKQLTIILDSIKISFLPEIDPEIIKEFNNRLDKDGYDFAVNFEIVDARKISPIDYYERCIDENKTIDIISCETEISQDIINSFPESFECKAHEKIFWEFVDKNYLISLNDYLKTNQGEQLYNIFPEIYWDRITDNDGKIYGIYDTIYDPLSLEFVEDVADKYNYDYKKFNGNFTSLESILKKMKNESDVAGLYINTLFADTMYEYFEYSCLDCGIYINERTGKAENIFNNEDFIKYIKTISKFKKSGYILDLDEHPDDLKTCLCTTARFSSTQDYNQMIIADSYLKNRDSCGGLGITSSSKYPDEAFKLLYLLYTDSEYASLLQCGIEGKNYTITNKNEVELNEEYSTFGDLDTFQANPYITDRNFEMIVTTEEKQRLLKEMFKRVKKSKTYGFEYPETDKTKAIKEIYKKYDGLYYGAFNNVEKTLEQANNELKSAGLDEVLNDINRQLEKYYNKNNF